MNPAVFWISFAVLIVVGLFVPFWPLLPLAVLFAGLWGYRFASIVLALALDALWGTPPGIFGKLLFPFVVLSLCAIALNLFARRFMAGASLPKTLY